MATCGIELSAQYKCFVFLCLKEDRFPIIPTVIERVGQPKVFQFESMTANACTGLAARVDADSFYLVNKTLLGMALSLGSKTVWHMGSVTSSHYKCESSRFSINEKFLFGKLNAESSKPVPLGKYPNVTIATVRVAGSIPIDFFVSLFYLGGGNDKKRSHFSHNELAVINAALNIARRNSCKEDTKNEHPDISRTLFFQSKVGRNQHNKHIKNVTSKITSKSMLLFSSHFEKAMSLIANNDDAYSFENAEINGMFNPEESNPSTPSRSIMVEIANDFQRGLLFHASAAGVKTMFSDPNLTFHLSERHDVYGEQASSDASTGSSESWNEEDECFQHFSEWTLSHPGKPTTDYHEQYFNWKINKKMIPRLHEKIKEIFDLSFCDEKYYDPNKISDYFFDIGIEIFHQEVEVNNDTDSTDTDTDTDTENDQKDSENHITLLNLLESEVIVKEWLKKDRSTIFGQLTANTAEEEIDADDPDYQPELLDGPDPTELREDIEDLDNELEFNLEEEATRRIHNRPGNNNPYATNSRARETRNLVYPVQQMENYIKNGTWLPDGEDLFDTYGVDEHEELENDSNDPAYPGTENGDADSDENHNAEDEPNFFEVIDSIRQTKYSKFAQFGSKGKLGGIHSGSVELFLVTKASDHLSGGHALVLIHGHSKKEIAGVQVYSPFSRVIIQKQGTLQDRELGAYAANVQAFLSPTTSGNASAKELLRRTVAIQTNKIKQIFQVATSDKVNHLRNNPLRFEFFMCTKSFKTSDPDYKLPSIPLSQMLYISDSKPILTIFEESNMEHITPLVKVFSNSTEGTQFSMLSAELKTELVRRAERCLEGLEFFPFEGKVSSFIRKFAVENQEDPPTELCVFETVPKQLMVQLCPLQESYSGLLYGLSPKVLPMPGIDGTTFFSERTTNEDKYFRRLPPHLQHNMHFQSGMITDQPVLLEKKRGRIIAMIAFACKNEHLSHEDDDVAMSHVEDGSQDEFLNLLKGHQGFFEEIEYQKLAKLSYRSLFILMQEIAKEIELTYNAEWYALCKKRYIMFKKKKRVGRNSPLEVYEKMKQDNDYMRLPNFPFTLETLRNFQEKMSTIPDTDRFPTNPEHSFKIIRDIGKKNNSQSCFQLAAFFLSF